MIRLAQHLRRVKRISGEFQSDSGAVHGLSGFSDAFQGVSKISGVFKDRFWGSQGAIQGFQGAFRGIFQGLFKSIM